MLAELMRLKYGIAIAGMHGKTTTTSMVAAVLAAGGLDPTVVVGGRVDAMGSNARLGKSEYLVAEADESDRSFLKLSPILAVVTNIDREHMDCYRDMDDVEQTFVEFMDHVPFYGMVVACNDNDDLRRLLPARAPPDRHLRHARGLRLSASPTCACGPADEGRLATSSFPRAAITAAILGEFHLHVPGEHNVRNATAAIAVGIGLDIPVDKIREGLEKFNGVDRRFQLKGRANGVTVIDDYGHHPTEIRATLAAARQCGFAQDPRHLPAAPLHANAIAAGRVRDRVPRCRFGNRTGHLRRQRVAHTGYHGRTSRRANHSCRSHEGHLRRIICRGR